MHPAEKVAAIEGEPVPGLELDRVAAEPGRVDGYRVGARAQEHPLAQGIPEVVERLPEGSLGLLGGGLGPEERLEGIPANVSLRPGQAEIGQERQALGLHGDGLFPRSQAPGQLESAQGLETQHVMAFGERHRVGNGDRSFG